MTGRWGEQSRGWGGWPSGPELLVYLVAGAYAAAGVAVMARSPRPSTPVWLLDAALTVGLAVLVLCGTLAVRRAGARLGLWWHVAGGYVAGVGITTTLLVWLAVAGGADSLLPDAVQLVGPDSLRPAVLVAAGNAGGVLGFVAGRLWGGRAIRGQGPSLVLDEAPAAAWLFRPDASEALYVNPSYEALFDQPVTAVESDPTAFIEAAHPDDRDALSDAMNAVAGGDGVDLELRVDLDTPTERWVWISGWPIRRDGEVVAVAGFAYDVTDRRRHREQLVSLHDATRRLFRAESDTEAAEIATEAAEAVLGLPVTAVWLYDESADELQPAATEVAESVVADDRSLPTFQAGDSLAREVFESGEPQVYDDVRTAPGGEDAPTRSEIVLPLGEFGVFMAGSTTAGSFDRRQISLANVLAANVEVALARIEGTRRLEESRQALERRNERLDEFASVVSHDLRNPLNVARGNLDFLRAETDSERVETVDDALQRMESLIDDLLTLAREGREIDERRPVSLADSARSAWANVETERASLTVDGDGTVHADEDRLAQLFENLFRNAVEHGTTEDDPLTVTVGRLPDGFYVTDDGRGIPPEQRDDVLSAGYTTADGGTGLGLSIVQTIAEAHGWAVTVTESEAGGARFEIRGVAFE
jgi:PAS domain S-box-containing protein